MFCAGTVQWAWGLDTNHDGTDARRPTAHAAGHGQHARRHGRASPTTLASGLIAGDEVDRHRGADRRRSPQPAAGARFAPGHQVTVTGTATDSGGRVAGSRSRSTVARPGTRPTGATLHLHRRARRDRRRRHPGARDRRLCEHPGNPTQDSRSTVNAPARIFGALTPADPVDRGHQRRRRWARVSPSADRRLHHRHAVLQGNRQHRHAHRNALPGRRHGAGHRHFQQRDGDAAGRRSLPAAVPVTAGTTTSRRTTRRTATMPPTALLRLPGYTSGALTALGGTGSRTACSRTATFPRELPADELLRRRCLQSRPTPRRCSVTNAAPRTARLDPT